MDPSIKKELKSILELRHIDFTPITPLPRGLRPIYKKGDEIVAYDTKHNAILFIGKSEKSFTIDELKEILALAINER